MTNEKFTVKFAETDEEKRKTYAMRYRNMLKEYRPEIEKADGLDITPCDRYAKHIICIDNETGDVVGCYRMITDELLPEGEHFVCEEEFDISAVKATGERIAEFSRAVVKKEYRNSIVLMLLLRFIVQYVREENIRFAIGEASFAGVDKHALKNELSYLAHYHASQEIAVSSLDQEQIEIVDKEKLDVAQIKRNLPPLIRAYIGFGAKTSKDSFTDWGFGSVDVFILLDSKAYNAAYINRLLRL